MPTIAVDFDGVLHSYTSGWTGQLDIADPPVPGAFAWLTRVVAHYEVVIYSARLNPRGTPLPVVIGAFRAWFRRHGLPEETLEKLHFWTEIGKPMALVYVDDRGYRFEGHFPEPSEIRAMVPWKAALTEPEDPR